MQLPHNLKITILRFAQIELLLKFMKTRKAVRNKKQLWLLSNNEIEKKGYLNHWELSVTELIISSFVSSAVLIALVFIFTILGYSNYFENHKPQLLLSPLVIIANLILLWLFALPMTWIAIPRKTEKIKQIKALPIMLYHWGAHGLFVKCLFSVTSVVVPFYIFGVSFQEFPPPNSLKVMLSFWGLICVVLLWEGILVLRSIITVRKHYQAKYSKIKLSLKAIIIFTSLILVNSIVINISINYHYIIDLYNYLSHEDLLLITLITYLSIHLLYGTYCFIQSSNKAGIIKSAFIASFLFPLPGCATTSSYYPDYFYIESSPDTVILVVLLKVLTIKKSLACNYKHLKI